MAGTKSKAKKRGVRIVHEVANVDDEGKERQSKWVSTRMDHRRKEATGSNLTIIPPKLCRPSMGKVVKATSRLRSWGSDRYLDILGMFEMTLQQQQQQQKGLFKC